MDIEALRKQQQELAKLVVVNNKLKKVNLVAGCDLVGLDERRFVCCIAVLKYESLSLVDHSLVTEVPKFKYIPGFMGFSHGPMVVNAYLKLKQKPDVMMLKAHGIAHPLRLGMASQLGLQLNLPTIGVATQLLEGKVQDGKIIMDGEIRGAQLKTKEFSNPVYVSPGHMVSLAKALEIVQHCIRPPHKLPEPIFVAHKLAKQFKKTLKGV